MISPARRRIIERIEACAALTHSSFSHEAALAADRARDLVARYEIAASELTPEARAQLAPFDIAAQLTIIHACYTKRAEEPGRWMVTGLGPNVSAAEMAAFAAERGVTSRFSPPVSA